MRVWEPAVLEGVSTLYMTEKLKPPKKKSREEALPERLLRRVFESMGDVVDRKFGRTVEPKSGLTTSQLIDRMKRLIDERVRDEGRKGRIAPHYLKLKVEWGTHSEAPPEILKELEHEVLAEAIVTSRSSYRPLLRFILKLRSTSLPAFLSSHIRGLKKNYEGKTQSLAGCEDPSWDPASRL